MQLQLEPPPPRVCCRVHLHRKPRLLLVVLLLLLGSLPVDGQVTDAGSAKREEALGTAVGLGDVLSCFGNKRGSAVEGRYQLGLQPHDHSLLPRLDMFPSRRLFLLDRRCRCHLLAAETRCIVGFDAKNNSSPRVGARGGTASSRVSRRLEQLARRRRRRDAVEGGLVRVRGISRHGSV
eukprot:750634-Hanusia_phi.AAC.1